ncbi:hypothetical protein ACWCQN_25140 [Streptomyces sp. NPDC001984]
MKWILLGALLGLLTVLCPAVVLATATHPLVVAFAAGIAARPYLARRMRGWTA